MSDAAETTETYTFMPGEGPLLISIPHAGIAIPPDIAAAMTDAARLVPDTDWHVDRLYDFAPDLGAAVIAARQSRFVIDLNRAPDGKPLYPGASNTELCPTTSFADDPLYRAGSQPDAAEIARRRDRYWMPYHTRIRQTLDAFRARHGFALLYDAHSIRSQVPRFFDGRLPDLNLGTADGTACAAGLREALAEVAVSAAPRYTMALDGRFKGGFITRAYGRPKEGVHAFQLELSWRTYMDEDPPFAYRVDLAAGIRPVLRAMVETMARWRP